MTHPTLEETIAFMKKAHEGQVDKNGIPFWEHPYAVYEIVRDVYYGGEDEQHAALLHDVIEDTEITAQDILDRGYKPEIVDMVVWVSRIEDLTYHEWIIKLANEGPFGAIKVKLADNHHNMNRFTDIPELMNLKKRYKKAREVLLHRYYKGF